MVKMVGAVCTAAMALVAHWLSVGVAIASMLGRALTFAARCVGSTCSALAEGLPLVRQQLFDPAVQLRRQPREHVLQIRPRLVPIELGRLRRSPNYAEWARFCPHSP